MKLRSVLLASVCTVFAVSSAISAHAQSAPVSAPPARGGFYGLYARRSAAGASGSRCGTCSISPRRVIMGPMASQASWFSMPTMTTALVKRISYGLPASQLPGAKVSGITASVPLNMIYVTYLGHMTAFDLSTDQIAWTFNGDGGPVVRHFFSAAASGCCERPWTLPDGKTLFVNSSYNDWAYLIDGATGKSKGRITTPTTPVAHNLAVTADGRTAFFSSETGPQDHTANVAVIDIPARKVVRTLTFSDSVRPLTINHDGSLVYVNVNNLDGFEIGDTRTGEVIKRVELPGEMWKAKWADPNHHFFGHGLPSHGIGMTPDDSEIWVTDAINDSWQIWDNPGDGRNPVYNPSKTVKTTPGIGSSWICMTNDGKLAFVGDGSIIDVKAHKVIGVMKDEYGRPIHAAEKVLYLTFQDGKLVETNNQFAVGDPKAYAARVAALGGTKQASK